MYTIPPTRVKVNTGAHIVGTITTTIVAAPGVGFALRIYYWGIGIGRTTGGVVDEFLRSGTTSDPVAAPSGLQLTGTSFAGEALPFPGYQLPANEALVLDSISTAATGLSICLVAYYVDALT